MTVIPRPMALLSPSITRMIRFDHSHVLLTAHRYTADAPVARKQAIVDAVCPTLEIHAQLEEEIFYPALRECGVEHETLEKSEPDHAEMRRLIGELRTRRVGEGDFDATFMQLMRAVQPHVADEETLLLPAAELALHDRLGELGAQMTKRRLQLVAPRAGELTVGSLRAMPPSWLWRPAHCWSAAC